MKGMEYPPTIWWEAEALGNFSSHFPRKDRSLPPTAGGGDEVADDGGRIVGRTGGPAVDSDAFPFGIDGFDGGADEDEWAFVEKVVDGRSERDDVDDCGDMPRYG